MDGPINPEVGFDDGMRWVELFDLIFVGIIAAVS